MESGDCEGEMIQNTIDHIDINNKDSKKLRRSGQCHPQFALYECSTTRIRRSSFIYFTEMLMSFILLISY